jgi:hypothetical protein
MGRSPKVAEDMFERLLKAMPGIASVVNQFESSAVQEQAFDALIRALGLVESPPAAPGVSTLPDLDSAAAANGELNGDAGEAETKDGTASPAARRKRRSTPTRVSAVDSINFRPKDKQPFRDLVDEKKPSNQPERNLIAVYWLEQILGETAITAGHVLAAYKDCNWMEPNSVANSLQVTASTKKWINTTNMAAIHTTPSGRNQVEHYMPAAKK